ncbi:hypothetical protein NC99_20780 [Sunxiuqinia dokdonensis]|uniref:Uncharacterized protein n=1 Tax=Sunxiuqinia dokdonensis TaxID=1409788 RepID=A0A0L8V9U2_9BACT|nr:hypothetical protein NC99_20780 [Sunxiuqinia dokdonensis]
MVIKKIACIFVGYFLLHFLRSGRYFLFKVIYINIIRTF